MSEEIRQGGGPFFAQIPDIFANEDWPDKCHIAVYYALRLTADFGEAGETVSGCYDTAPNLADKAGLGVATFRRKVKDLADQGLVEWDSGRENGGRNVYTVHFSRQSDRKVDHGDQPTVNQTDQPNQPRTTNTENQHQDTNNGDSGEEVVWEDMTRSQRLAKSTPTSPCPRIAEVFQWCRDYREGKLNKRKGISLSLTDKRHRQIKARLKKFDVDQLKRAYKSMLHNDYHVNEGYTYPETCLKNDSTVEQHLDQYDDRVNSSSTSNLIESDKERYLN